MLAFLASLVSKVKSIPFVGTALSFVADKFRLVIEYVLIGLLITVAGFTLALWLEKSNLQDSVQAMTTKLAGVEINDKVQNETIEQLKDLRLQDAQAISGLLDDYKYLAKHDRDAEARLNDLEKSNATVRAYLDSSIPPELVCLLNNTCAPSDDSKVPATPAP